MDHYQAGLDTSVVFYAVNVFDDNLCVWMCLAIYKRLARREKNRVEERTFEATLNLACEYYGEKKGM